MWLSWVRTGDPWICRHAADCAMKPSCLICDDLIFTACTQFYTETHRPASDLYLHCLHTVFYTKTHRLASDLYLHCLHTEFYTETHRPAFNLIYTRIYRTNSADSLHTNEVCLQKTSICPTTDKLSICIFTDWQVSLQFMDTIYRI